MNYLQDLIPRKNSETTLSSSSNTVGYPQRRRRGFKNLEELISWLEVKYSSEPAVRDSIFDIETM
jgi:hypothetical protein